MAQSNEEDLVLGDASFDDYPYYDDEEDLVLDDASFDDCPYYDDDYPY